MSCPDCYPFNRQVLTRSTCKIQALRGNRISLVYTELYPEGPSICQDLRNVSMQKESTKKTRRTAREERRQHNRCRVYDISKLYPTYRVSLSSEDLYYMYSDLSSYEGNSTQFSGSRLYIGQFYVDHSTAIILRILLNG